MAEVKINVLILGAGVTASGTAGNAFPAFMAEVKGTPLIQRMVESCNGLDSNWIGIACQSTDIENFRIAELPSLLHPKAGFVVANRTTQGAACTALLAAEQIDNDKELLIIGVNEYIEADFKPIIDDFRERQLDGGILAFNSIHPRYSYVKLGLDGMVQQVAEKRPISNIAASTFFWFRRGSDFVSAAKDVIRKNDHLNGFYYIAPTINQLLLRQKYVGVAMIDGDRYYPLKTMRQIENFETVQQMRR